MLHVKAWHQYQHHMHAGWLQRQEQTWNASTLPRRYWTWLSTTSLVRRRISRHKWNALPKRDFFLSCIIQSITTHVHFWKLSICKSIPGVHNQLWDQNIIQLDAIGFLVLEASRDQHPSTRYHKLLLQLFNWHVIISYKAHKLLNIVLQ